MEKAPQTTELSPNSLLERIRKNDPKADLELVRRAFEFGKWAHDGQFRSSGEPYFVHPIHVAETLADMKVPATVIVAGLLHDVPEDTAVTLDQLKQEFGDDVTSMVRGITKLGTLKYRGIERYIENLRKMFIAMASDVRVVLIKFADRLHNLETLDALPPEKRTRIALESLEIYAPIANRLGLHGLRVKLEDLSFRHVMPSEFAWVKGIADRYMSGKVPYIERVRQLIEDDLQAADIKYLKVGGRAKHLYSLYKKLLKFERDIVQIHDLLALRVIVPEISDCYATLGIIHQRWKPLKGRIKDYIARPKANGYRSLHTTVFCESGEIVEIQIRTSEMHEEAERGIAAHWRYDEGGKRSVPVDPHGNLAWVKEISVSPEGIEDASELMEQLDHMKIDMFRQRIFVFTPKGDVIDLPEGSTPVDFAYAIHSEVGDHATAAKINEHIVPLNRRLSSGDCCEIVTDKNRRAPNPAWLDFVKTPHARERIRARALESLSRWQGPETEPPAKKKPGKTKKTKT